MKEITYDEVLKAKNTLLLYLGEVLTLDKIDLEHNWIDNAAKTNLYLALTMIGTL